MKMRSLMVTVAAGFFASMAWAGGDGHGCMYGKSHAAMASAADEASTPVIAAEADAVDPKLLALQKRLELEAASQQGTVQVPN